MTDEPVFVPYLPIGPGPAGLHVVLTLDDAAWAPAFAAMRSACLASRRRAEIVFHLVEWRLEPEHRDELDDITLEFGARVIHYPIEADDELGPLIASLPRVPAAPSIAYGRLLLDKLLPQSVKKFVYLDCAVLVRAPVETLFDVDLSDKPLAAVSAPDRQARIGGDDMRHRTSPFDSADDYFDTGVLVIDRARWAGARFPSMVRDLLATNELRTLYDDEDIINLAFRNTWLPLEPRWNMLGSHRAAELFDPLIVRYRGVLQPWMPLAPLAFAHAYRQVMTRALCERYRRYRLRKAWDTIFNRTSAPNG